MKNNLFKFGFVVVFFLFFLSAGEAKADAPVTVHLEIETATSTLFNDFITVTACPESLGSATTTINGMCALEQSGLSLEMSWAWAPAGWVSSIGGASEVAPAGPYWLWFSDLNLSNDAINQHPLTAEKNLLFVLGVSPLKISASNFSPYDGATTTISVWQFNSDVNEFNWEPASNATIDFGWGATTTDANGQADITATSTTPFSVSASKTNFLTSNYVNITPQAAQTKITIRDGATVVFSGTVALPASNASAVDIAPTNASSTVAVPARSLLSVLEILDATQNEFAITDLQYSSDWDSFYIKCITITTKIDSLCNSWQYNLNGVNPPVGIDKSVLKNGDIVFLYFGNQRQVTLSTAVATIGASFTATAQKYDPVNNAYVASTGFIIGVTQPNPNPNDWWNPIEIATSTADANGQAVFTINTAGIYNVGIKEYGNIYDSYFPLTTLTITAPVPSSGGSVILPTASGGGTATVISSPKVDLGKAIDFLIAKQGADGSYGSSLQTDWAAIALASTNPNGSAAQKTKSYLLADPDPLIGMNPVSDYARRAMALMSLNISPYDGTKTNYIKKIISLYDGQQFGDASLYNDDIFALMVLAKAGYTADDEIIQNAVNFIISKQQVEGSWAGTDLTAAAIQALTPLSSLTEVTSALEKARNFLADAQATNGGFGNTYATAWAMQAIAALGENSSDWQKNGQTPESYLALSQGADGGLEKDNTYEANRIWATSYAIPAIQSKPWFNIMQNFSKQAEPALVEISVNEINIAADEIATSTLEKLDIATSSPEVLITASSTESSLQIKTVEEKIEPKTVDVFPEPVKPRVLSAKIVSPEPINMGNIKIEKKPNQEITQRETAPADAAIQASVQDNGGMAWATAKEKINTMAKKVLYFVTDGVAAAAALILKLLEFVL